MCLSDESVAVGAERNSTNGMLSYSGFSRLQPNMSNTNNIDRFFFNNMNVETLLITSL